MTIFHEEKDCQSGYLEEEYQRATGTKLEARTLSAAGRSALRYRFIEEGDDYDADPITSTPAPVYRPRRVRIPAATPILLQPARHGDEGDEDEDEDSRYMRKARHQAAELVRHTDEDPEIAPSVRGSRSQSQSSSRKPHRWLSLAGAAAVAAALAILGWQATTAVPAWYTTTFSDPGTYGPLHGQALSVVLGNGDTTLTPSTLLATNLNGQVLLVKLFPSDPKKNITFTGPNLVLLNFPDPTKAEVELRALAPGQIQIIIWSNVWDKPFHRYGVSFTLVSDGKGGLSQSGSMTVMP